MTAVFASAFPVLGAVVAQNVFFYMIAAVMVIAALRVVTTNNIVHSALYLVVVLAGVAAQFILLGAEFVGVTQVLVYIGAVIVLFLFGIMLTRAKVGAEDGLTHDNVFPAVLTAILLVIVMAYAVVDFGVLSEPPTEIAGVASVDVDGDGIRETKLESGSLVLLDDDGAEVDRAVVGVDGTYSFDGLAPGTYLVMAEEGLIEADPEDPDEVDVAYDEQRLRTVKLDKVKEIDVEDRTQTTVEQVSDSIFSTYIVAFEAISVLLLAALIGAIVVARKE